MAQCIICDASAFREHLGDLVQCEQCGHVFAPLNGPDFDASSLYGESYFRGDEYCDYARDEFCYKLNFRSRLRDVRRHCASGAMVEIGSAYGFFLDLARHHFSVIGYEVCPEAAEVGRSRFALDIRCTDFLSDDLADGSCDAIVLWDVIEHLPAPQDVIARSWKLLRKGGVLAFTTGDIGSALARRQGRRWRLIHPPTHIHYFSRSGAERLLRRHRFEVAEVSYPGYWRSVRQIAYSLLVLKEPARPSLFGAIDATPLARIPLYLNTHDIMQVIARKC